MSAKEFIASIRSIESSKGTDDVMDFIFDTIDDLLLEGSFDSIDVLLQSLQQSDLKEIKTDSILAILGITVAAKDHLPNRPEFFKVVAKELEGRGHLVDESNDPNDLLKELE